MKKALFPIGVAILIVSLILAAVGPVSAVGSGQLEILKKDQSGNALVGATFVISPNPHNWTAPDLTVVDNGINDNNSADGVLLVQQCNVSPVQEYTVTETVAPAGYTLAPSQTTIIDSETVESPITLTFINTPTIGGDAQPVSKVGVFIPWVGLAFIVAGGITWFVVKRRSG